MDGWSQEARATGRSVGPVSATFSALLSPSQQEGEGSGFPTFGAQRLPTRVVGLLDESLLGQHLYAQKVKRNESRR